MNKQFLFFMVWVKIFHFWPCWNWKSAISCWNEKSMRQIFYMLESTWKCIRKSLKSCEIITGKISHFCLGPKTLLGYYDPRFDLSSKISVVGSSFWKVVLTLVWNRNYAENSYSGVWPFFEIHTLKLTDLKRNGQQQGIQVIPRTMN